MRWWARTPVAAPTLDRGRRAGTLDTALRRDRQHRQRESIKEVSLERDRSTRPAREGGSPAAVTLRGAGVPTPRGAFAAAHGLVAGLRNTLGRHFLRHSLLRGPDRRDLSRLVTMGSLCALLAALLPASPARAIEVLPLSEVQPGMTGVGRSVFRGTEIVEFGVEIIGVIERARPAGNLILFRGQGEFLEHTGISQGMSGSPVYIEGKLIGAVAFAYPGAKDPVGAITPIDEMLALWEGGLGPAASGPYPSLGDAVGPEPGGAEVSPRTALPSASPSLRTLPSEPLRGPTPPPASPLDPTVPTVSGALGTVDTGTTAGQYFDFDAVWRSFVVSSSPAPGQAFGDRGDVGPTSSSSSARVTRSGTLGAGATAGRDVLANAFRTPREVGSGTAESGLAPIGTPLCFSGWDPGLHTEIASVFGRLGMPAVPVTGGLAGASGRYPGVDRLEPGGAIGLRMIGGDADLVAIGTVTHVDGDRVVAFGHPMIQAGAVAFPMTGVWIHTVVANRSVSAKMGSSTNELGGIWNDRRPGIAGLHGAVPEQLPVRVTVAGPDGAPEPFRYTLARHPMLTPFFLPWTVTNSYLASGWVTGDASIRTAITVHYDGGRSVRRVERIGAEAPGTSLGADITLPAVLLAINPWETVRLDSLSVEVEYERGNPHADVVSVASSHRRAHPGDVVTVSAALQPFRGEPVTETFSFTVPAAWAGRSLRLYVGANAEFASWDADRVPEKFVPHSLDQMVAMIERMPDDSVLTLRVYDREAGVLLQGVELAGLPPSLAEPSSQGSRPGGILPTEAGLLEERHLDTRFVLSGGTVVPLEIASW